MDRRQLEMYLQRIGLDDVPPANAAGLHTVQRAHLQTVPFENLDIMEGRIPLALDEESLFQKIVVRRRGGICYELNLLFAAALRAMGFHVVLKGGWHPKYGDEMDHVFLLVNVPDVDEPMLADVGFAYNFAAPLVLQVGLLQNDGRDRYLIEPSPNLGEGHLRIMRIAGLAGEGEKSELYAFGPREFQPEDCRERCDWLCTSPESRFTQGPLVCIDADQGRQTLSARHFITTRGEERIVEEVVSAEQFAAHLNRMME